MKNFIALIHKVKKQYNHETDGAALAHILTCADMTEYIDWRIEDLEDLEKEIEMFE